MTEQEFAQKIRDKFPQYVDIPDTELVAKVIEKYPVYKDKIVTTIPTPQPKRDYLKEEVQKVVKPELFEKQTPLAGRAAIVGTLPLRATGAGLRATGKIIAKPLSRSIEGISDVISNIPLVQKFATSRTGEGILVGAGQLSQIASSKLDQLRDTIGEENYQSLKDTIEIAMAITGQRTAKPAVSAAATAAEQAAMRATSGVGGAAAATTQAIKGATEAVGGFARGVKAVTTGAAEAVAQIPSRVAINVAEKQAAREVIQQLPTKVAQKAAKSGVDVADIKTILQIPKTQKGPIKKLVQSVKDFASGASKVRPEEVVGRPITQAIKKLESIRGKIGKELGDAAKTLGVVTEQELVEPIFSALKKVPGLSGLTMRGGRLNFKNTVLTTAETASDRKAIQSIFTQATRWGKGEAKHKLRQELFEILGGKKRSLTTLTATQEKAYQAIRQGLSDVLDLKNSTYKALNKEFAKIAQPLADLRKFFRGVSGADEDILDMASGLLARRLTSYAPSNPQIRNILRSIDNALKAAKVKGETLVNTENLQDIYNVLDRYYDITAKTSYKGQTRAAIESVPGSLTETAFRGLKSVAGETPAVRQKALEQLLDSILQ